MFIVLLVLIGGVVYFACPLPIQLLLMIGNFFIPDPIPFLDEIIMVGGIISKLYFLDNLYWNIRSFSQEVKGFITKHKRLIVVVLLLLLISLCKMIFMPKV